MGICTGSIKGILSVGLSCHNGESHGKSYGELENDVESGVIQGLGGAGIKILL